MLGMCLGTSLRASFSRCRARVCARGFDENLTFDFLVPGGDIGSRARSFCLEVWALRVAGGG